MYGFATEKRAAHLTARWSPKALSAKDFENSGRTKILTSDLVVISDAL